jgi:valacyclovir hydrolase
MPIISTRTGAQLQYEERSSQHPYPLIALHGLLGTAKIDLEPVLDALGVQYHVYAPTLRGYGESEPKPRTFPPDFYERDAEDVLAFMDALDIVQAHIIGYSDGGEVALLAAAKQPGRFASVATWGSMGIVPPELMPQADDLGAGIPGVGDLEQVAREVHGITDPEAVIAEWTESYSGIIQRGGELARAQADKLTMPVLIILGNADELAPLRYGQQLVDTLPNGQLKVFAGGGHALHHERPGELVEVMLTFFHAIK